MVLAASAWHDAALLMRYPVAAGVDGYYYVLQVDALRSTGRFYFSTKTPLVLYFLAALRFLSGDTIVSNKIGIIILHLSLCAGIFALVKSCTGSFRAGLLGSLIAAASSLHLYMIVEFVNNLGATALLVWCAWTLVRAAQTRRLVWLIATSLLLAGAAFSHRSALALALAVTACALLARWLLSRFDDRRARWTSLLLLLALWLAPAIYSRVGLAWLPAWAGREVSTVPRWPMGSDGLAEGLMLLLAAPATLYLLVRLRGHGPVKNLHVYTFGSAALLSLLVTLNPFLASAEGWVSIIGRLRGLAYIQAAVLLGGLGWMSAAVWRYAVPYLLAALLPLLVLSYLAPLPNSLQPEYQSSRMQIIRSLPLYASRLDPATLVIAPHGDQFIVTSVLGIRAQQRLATDAAPTDAYTGGKGQPVYWLVRRMRCDAGSSQAMILATEAPGQCAVLMEEGQLRQLAHALNVTDWHRVLAANPHVREAHLSD